MHARQKKEMTEGTALCSNITRLDRQINTDKQCYATHGGRPLKIKKAVGTVGGSERVAVGFVMLVLFSLGGEGGVGGGVVSDDESSED